MGGVSGKEKVLIFSDSPNICTGFGCQANLLMRGFADAGYDVYVIGIAFHGESIKLRDNITLLSMGEERFGDDILEFYLNKLQPAFLISLLDLYMDDYILKIDLAKYGTKWIKWFPLDSVDMIESWIHTINLYPNCVTFSEISNRLVKEYCLRDVPNIPHMVDTDIFKPLTPEEKSAFRIRSIALKPEDFVLGAVGRNQIRKMHPQMMTGFARFAANKANAKLVLHCGYRNSMHQGWPAQGWNLEEIARQLNIPRDKLVWSTEHDTWFAKFMMTPEKMKILYNTMDLHWLSANEGFGIPAIEAMACGVPNIIADFTTGKELTKNGTIGKLYPIISTWWQPVGVRWGMDDPNAVADALQYFYDNPDELKKHSKEARAYAEEKYSYKVVMPQWLKLLEKLKTEPPAETNYKGVLGI